MESVIDSWNLLLILSPHLMFQKKPLLTHLFSCLKLNQTAISLIDSDSKSHVSSDVDGSFQEQNVSDMDITNLSMEVVHPCKNPSTNSVTTFLSKMYILLLTTPSTGSIAC